MEELYEMSPLVFLSGLNTPTCTMYLVNRPSFIIGRAEECNAALRFSSAISRKHARIDWQEGRYTLTDLGSTNHTYINGVELIPNKPYPLKPRDTVSFSDFSFLVEPLAL